MALSAREHYIFKQEIEKAKGEGDEAKAAWLQNKFKNMTEDRIKGGQGITPLDSALSGGFKGYTGGGADEVSGALMWSMGGDYKKNRDEWRRDVDLKEKMNPGTFKAAETIGGFLPDPVFYYGGKALGKLAGLAGDFAQPVKRFGENIGRKIGIDASDVGSGTVGALTSGLMSDADLTEGEYGAFAADLGIGALGGIGMNKLMKRLGKDPLDVGPEDYVEEMQKVRDRLKHTGLSPEEIRKGIYPQGKENVSAWRKFLNDIDVEYKGRDVDIPKEYNKLKNQTKILSEGLDDMFEALPMDEKRAMSINVKSLIERLEDRSDTKKGGERAKRLLKEIMKVDETKPGSNVTKPDFFTESIDTTNFKKPVELTLPERTTEEIKSLDYSHIRRLKQKLDKKYEKFANQKRSGALQQDADFDEAYTLLRKELANYYREMPEHAEEMIDPTRFKAIKGVTDELARKLSIQDEFERMVTKKTSQDQPGRLLKKIKSGALEMINPTSGAQKTRVANRAALALTESPDKLIIPGNKRKGIEIPYRPGKFSGALIDAFQEPIMQKIRGEQNPTGTSAETVNKTSTGGKVGALAGFENIKSSEEMTKEQMRKKEEEDELEKIKEQMRREKEERMRNFTP
jgi:hypothetical protein